MSIITKTYNARMGAPKTESAIEVTPTAQAHYLDPKVGPYATPLDAGAQAGQTLTSAAQAITAGKDVVLVVDSQGLGSLAIEDSPNGTAWTPVDSFPVPAHVPMGYRFTPSAAFYRFKFTAEHAANKVTVYSQHRA